MNIRPLLSFASVGLLVCVAVSTSHADDRRDNATMAKLLEPLGEKIGDGILQVMCGGRPVSLATAVHPDGYLVTKRSELSGDPIRVRDSLGRLHPARVAAVRRRNDLALLKADIPESVRSITWAPVMPNIGSFLISVGRTGRTLGLGVLSAPPRSIAHQGRLGVRLNDRARVIQVLPNSGANEAGMLPGDLIVAVNGQQQNTRISVMGRLKELFPGEEVRLTIKRADRESSSPDTVELAVPIRELRMIEESENDTRVNGRRNERLSGFDRVIQHDTFLNPNECGGPVIDTRGRVVGINIARAGRVVSYALPASLVKSEVDGMLAEVGIK